jgi:hypothetical protein
MDVEQKEKFEILKNKYKIVNGLSWWQRLI